MEALLGLVPPADRAVVRATARRIATPSAGGMYDGATVAVAVTAMAPWLPDDRLALLVRYCQWTVALDAHLDSPADSTADSTPDSTVDSTMDSIVGPAAGVRTALPCSDRLAVELAHVLAGLRAYDGAGLLPRFEAALDDAIAASAALARLSHRVALGREPPPAAGDYLDLAARDVNYRSVALALLLLTADGDGGVDRLDPALATACRAVRLANDLATAAKDRRDGRLNVLGLRWRGGSPVTADDVDREIDRCMQVHAGLLRGTTGAVWTRALVNSLRMAVGLFRLAAG